MNAFCAQTNREKMGFNLSTPKVAKTNSKYVAIH